MWFIGDSQMGNFYRAMACFLRHFAADRYVQDAHIASLNKTIAVACFQLQEPLGKFCQARSDHLTEMTELIDSLHEVGMINEQSIVMLNSGLHYDPNDLKAYHHDLLHLIKFNNRKMREFRTVWMDTPAQHFPGTPLGDYDAAQHCSNCTFSCSPLSKAAAESGGPYNSVTFGLANVLGDLHLQTWDLTVLPWYTHLAQAKGDCTRSCHPSAYQFWVFKLYQLFPGTER